MTDIRHDNEHTSRNTSEGEFITLNLIFHGQPLSLDFPSTATISDLSTALATDLDIPSTNQKLLISPKPGLLRPPFKDPNLPLSSILTRKITLLGSTSTEQDSINTAIASLKAKQSARSEARRSGRKIQASRHIDSDRIREESLYSFASIRPLQYLPNPSKSTRFLERLANDPGIKSSMRKHHFSVGLLTEMNPAEHTTHESRTLGLNRNAGEVIELRLRTDAYDGYRDYKVIRKTLCHELAHNVWGEHDRNFWNLCREIEGEVERGDWTRGGNSVGGEEFYNPADGGIEDEEADDCGWTGGEYVLGARASNGEERPTIGSGTPQALSRRDIMAKAAEERMKKQQAANQEANGSNPPPGA